MAAGRRGRLMALEMLAALWSLGCGLLLAPLAATGEKGPLLVNKCCPARQQLNQSTYECIEFPSSNEPLVESENVTELRRRLPEGINLPLWMDNDAQFYISEDEDPIEGHMFPFLQEAPPNAVIQYGRRPCPFEDAQILSASRGTFFNILPNGSLQLDVMQLTSRGRDDTTDLKIYLPPQNWCSDRSSDGEIYVLACPCGQVLCVPQCCYKSQRLHITSTKWAINPVCVDGYPEFVPSFYKDTCLVAGLPFQTETEKDTAFNYTSSVAGCLDYERSETTLPKISSVDESGCDNTSQSIIYTVLEKHQPICKKDYSLLALNYKAAPLRWRAWSQINGSAILENFDGSPYHRHDFCLDRKRMKHGLDYGMVANALFCQKIVKKKDLRVEDYFYIFLFSTGGAFLLLTVVTHALVPMLRRSDHSKALCCHCLALFVASMTMISGHVGLNLEEGSCKAAAFIVQFSFLAAFFWLNVMCFDCAKSFTRMRQNISTRRSSRLFIMYSLYAWGSAALVTGITIAIDSLPAETVCESNPLRPNIAVKSCWFIDGRATLLYYYLPISLVLLSNVVMFGVTVLRIHIVKLGTSILRKKDNSASTKDKKKADPQMSSVIVRLFLLMGVTWVTEIVAWWVAPKGFSPFVLMDAVNLLRGIAIFFITCRRKGVREQLLERAHAVAGCLGFTKAAEALRPSPGSSSDHTSSDRTSSSALSLEDSVASTQTMQEEVNNIAAN